MALDLGAELKLSRLVCDLPLLRGGSILSRDIHLSSWGMIDTETETETDENITPCNRNLIHKHEYK